MDQWGNIRCGFEISFIIDELFWRTDMNDVTLKKEQYIR